MVLRHLNQLKHVSVPLPTDEDGFLGRECPAAECESYFKIKPGTGLSGDNLPCVCPYCGHSGPTNTFFTKEQIEYGKSVAMRQVSEGLRRDLKSLEFNHPPRGPLGLGISMKLKAGPLPAVRHYREQALETYVTCDSCSLDYSVFGVYGYCPDCSVHNSLQTLNSNLELINKQLDLADTIEDSDLKRSLLEDALENCVSAFDGFGRETLRIRSAKSKDPQRCESISFQNLERASSLIGTLFGYDLFSQITHEEREAAILRFHQRHLLAHKSGVIDKAFFDAVGPNYGTIGRRINVTSNEIRDLVALVGKLGVQLVGNLPEP